MMLLDKLDLIVADLGFADYTTQKGNDPGHLPADAVADDRHGRACPT